MKAIKLTTETKYDAGIRKHVVTVRTEAGNVMGMAEVRASDLAMVRYTLAEGIRKMLAVATKFLAVNKTGSLWCVYAAGDLGPVTIREFDGVGAEEDAKALATALNEETAKADMRTEPTAKESGQE